MKFKELFLEGILDLLWHQWTTLGVAGHGEHEGRVIDLDALLLATCVFGRHEARLFDEVLDWLGVNGWCINVQRLRVLMSQHAYGCERTLACVGSLQARGAETAKWRRLSLSVGQSASGSALEPFFHLPDGMPQPVFGTPEPEFARYAFHRGRLDLRGMSQPPNPDLTGNLMFRLRALFGVNARADILAYLLTHPDGHPPEMARQTGYFPKTVQMTLSEMARSGKIHSARRGREKHYRLDGAEWGFLRAQADWPAWVSWPQWFAAMAAIWSLAQNRKLAQASVQLQAAEWQKLMGRLEPCLAQSNPGMVPRDLSRLTGAKYLQDLQTELIRLSGLKPQ